MANAAKPLATATYDGSGQATEPSIIYFPDQWRGYRYWLALAPYPHSDAEDENPSILTSNDGIHWSPPNGIRNPVATPLPKTHLADPTLFYDKVSDQLWLYYIEAEADKNGYMYLARVISSDGIHWSTAERMLRSSKYQLVMPAVAKVHGYYWLWTVNAGRGGCSASSTEMQYRTSWDGVHWSAPQPVDLEQPGFKLWHASVSVLGTSNALVLHDWALELSPEQGDPDTDSILRKGVRRRTILPGSLEPNVLVMLVSAFADSCGRGSLFLAYSIDGIHWTHFSRPLLTAEAAQWDDLGIYQSTLVLDDRSELKVWYSAVGISGWHIGLAEGDFATLLRELGGHR